MTATVMPNENFEPSESQEDVLDVLKEEYRVNPLRVRNETGLGKQRVNNDLGSLVDAGWIRHVNQGLYEFIADPREDNESKRQGGDDDA